jgi:hypothetical protein
MTSLTWSHRHETSGQIGQCAKTISGYNIEVLGIQTTKAAMLIIKDFLSAEQMLLLYLSAFTGCC